MKGKLTIEFNKPITGGYRKLKYNVVTPAGIQKKEVHEYNLQRTRDVFKSVKSLERAKDIVRSRRPQNIKAAYFKCMGVTVTIV